MLTCIACSKQLDDGGADDEPAAARGGTPRTKEAVKSLTSQIKDMVLKFSGAYRQSKPCYGGASSSSAAAAAFRRSGSVGAVGPRSRFYAGVDAMWESGGSGPGSQPQLQYARTGGSSSSTPGWDFTCVDAESADARFADGGRRWMPALGTRGGEGPAEDGGPFDVAVEEAAKEWVAQVEPGVHITFLSLPGGGGNDLKRIRFREMFNKWQAQRWWGENYERVMELYNVQRFSRQVLPTPPRSDDEREPSYSRVGSTGESAAAAPPTAVIRRAASRKGRRVASNNGGEGGGAFHPVPDPTEHILQYYQNFPMAAPHGACWRPPAPDASSAAAAAPSWDEAPSASVSNASDQDATEWVEQDEAGVYITIRQLPDGTRELRRVRFSREHFAERHAKQWWELNRERIQAQYL